MSATMNQLPGSMTQMPLWTVSVNDDLLSSLIPLNGNVRSYLCTLFFLYKLSFEVDS
ncbi:hypothetical protein B296_00013049 [Ensete ventricosum]|uniref:Uncharacterized protein n=1 Tax=Ensete ventricosum TaxID=4639 RepID=A0A427AH89_ENSVE|nr:hypothetical protein B296_00013049 [Ensete ventricosum]